MARCHPSDRPSNVSAVVSISVFKEHKKWQDVIQAITPVMCQLFCSISELEENKEWHDIIQVITPIKCELLLAYTVCSWEQK